jgi:nicotinamide-nucleotide amidase
MKAAILTIGTELVRGQVVDTNASYLAERLAALGLDTTVMETVADHSSRIQSTLRRLGTEHDVLVCTGGLGPTSDDLTSLSVARLLGVPLERDPAQAGRIEAYFARTNRPASPCNLKQADLPQGATPLENPVGTAPGFVVWIRRARAFFLPGVPEEMTAMFSSAVEPVLRSLVCAPFSEIGLCVFGLPEGVVNDRLASIETAHRVTLGYRVSFPELEVKVLARGETEEEARQRARGAADQVRELLGPEVVYGEAPCSLAQAVGELLRQRALTVTLAESCTGGLVAELLTAAPGASDFFLGGLVAYANSAKQQLLEVPQLVLERFGAVSAEAARAMAEGARRVFGSYLALAVTGIAGPGGGSEQKPVGLVYLALAVEGGATVRELRLHGSRERIRRMAAFAALALLRRVLLRGVAGAVD